MLDLEVNNCVLDDGERGQVGGCQDVCNIAVDEDIAGFEAEDCCFGDAGVGAADPEDFGGLAFGESGEEVGVVLGDGGGPGFVGLEDGFDVFGCGCCEVGKWVSYRCGRGSAGRGRSSALHSSPNLLSSFFS